MTTQNIPTNSIPIRYSYGRAKGVYFIWPRGSKYQWSALGNCGEESSKEIAIEKAKDWILSKSIRQGE